MIRVLAALVALALSSSALAQFDAKFGAPNALLGKSGAASEASLDAAYINPAQAALMPMSEIQLSWGLQQQKYQQRYPGFEAHDSQTSGVAGPPIPGAMFKIGNRFALGGLIIPIQIKQPVDKKEIPFVVLNQENLVDISGEAGLTGYANVMAAMAPTPNFSIGLNIVYLAGTGDFSIVDSQSGGSVADVTAAISTLSIRAGVRLQLSRFSLGLVTTVYNQTSTDINFDSPLTEAVGGEQKKEDGGKRDTSTVFNPIRAGVGITLNPRLIVSADVEYKRVTQVEEYSIVDLKFKPKDLYDTVSFYSGLEAKMRSTNALLLGYNYEPTAVGPGSRGDGGKAGFGFTDIVTNLGEPPSTPAWSVSGGFRQLFLRRERRGYQGMPPPPPIYHGLFEVGLIYRETSLGIDNEGEQPGAYLVKTTKIPLKFSYRF